MPDWRLPSKQLRLGDTYDFRTPGGVVHVADPTVDTHAASKGYVDGLIAAAPPVEVCETNANITIDGTAALPNIDGHAVLDGERVLLTNQTDARENGIWVAHAIGTAWARPDDFEAGDQAGGRSVWVKQGTIRADTNWVCTTDPPNDVIGTNNLAFEQRTVDVVTVSTAAPTAGDDIRDGYRVGHLWLQVSGTDWTLWECIDATATAANWMVVGTRIHSEPSGLQTSDDTYTTITWVDGTTTFQIAPVGASFDVWVKGKKFTFTVAQTCVGDGTDFVIAEGVWFFYFDSAGVLRARQTYFVFEDETPVAYIYWDATAGAAIMFGDERHGLSMPWATHQLLHETVGARWDAVDGGLALTANVAGDGSLDAHAQVAVSDGYIYDEDLQIHIIDGAGGGRFEQELDPTAEIPVYYRNGPTNWRRKAANTFPVLEDGANRIKYNNYVAPNWVQPNVTAEGRYMAIWLFATNSYAEPIVAVIGQREDTTLANAENNNTFDSLDLSGFPFYEAKVIHRLIVQTATTYANTPHARWRNTLDFRATSPIPASASSVTDHNSLTGRGTFASHPETSLSTTVVDTNQILQPDGANGVTFNTADIDNCVAVDGAAAPTHTLMVGGKIFTAIPAAEADGDLAAFFLDAYRRLVPRGANLDAYTLMIENVAPALMEKWGPHTMPTLSAPGVTDSINVENYKFLMWVFTVADVNTNVIVQAEGSMDDTNFAALAPHDNSTTNWAIAAAQGTATADGTYALHVMPVSTKWTRFNFVSEAGGTDATIIPVLLAGN